MATNEKKTGVLFYETFWESVEIADRFDGKDAGNHLIRAILKYGLFGELPAEDDPVWRYFQQIKYAIDSAKTNYNKKISDGQNGGRPPEDIDIEEILTLQKSGYTIPRIAKELHTSESTIKRRLKKYREQTTAPDDEDDQCNSAALDILNDDDNFGSQTGQKVKTSSEPELTGSEPGQKCQNQVISSGSKVQFGQNQNKNKNKNKNMNLNKNENTNKNMISLDASREEGFTTGQNHVVKKSSTPVQNLTTSFEPIKEPKNYEEESSSTGQNSSCNFELINEPETQFHFETSEVQNYPGSSDPIMTPPPIDKEVLDRMKYNKDYLLQDGLIVVIETGEVFTIPRT